jgi:hypothetical protein
MTITEKDEIASSPPFGGSSPRSGPFGAMTHWRAGDENSVLSMRVGLPWIPAFAGMTKAGEVPIKKATPDSGVALLLS